jgi:hypothetical protein
MDHTSSISRGAGKGSVRGGAGTWRTQPGLERPATGAACEAVLASARCIFAYEYDHPIALHLRAIEANKARPASLCLRPPF